MTESPITDTRYGAVFSGDRTWRYRLWRIWDVESPTLAFIMLNPSTADETTLDPTCRRCRGYAEAWGYGTLLVGNLFALRSTDPGRLSDDDVDDPIGPDNDDHLQSICEDADRVVAAWGHHGSLMDRGVESLACSMSISTPSIRLPRAIPCIRFTSRQTSIPFAGIHHRWRS